MIRRTQKDELELGEAGSTWSARLLHTGGHGGWRVLKGEQRRAMQESKCPTADKRGDEV